MTGAVCADAADEGERGLALRYVKLSTTCWDAEGVRSVLESLRARDEEAELETLREVITTTGPFKLLSWRALGENSGLYSK